MKDKLFEEWAKTHKYKTNIENGFYINTHTQSAWEAWKASAPRELSDEEIMDCIEEKTGHPFNSCDEDLLEFARAILKKAREK